MENHQLRWGIMGCGFISGDFVEALALLPPNDHIVVAIASNDAESANDFKTTHCLSDAVVYESYESFVEDPNIDVVYIGTENNQHADNVILCAKAKKNILCEKPLGCNAAEVKKMFAVAKENNVFLQEALWSRFFPIYKAMKQTIFEGQIGCVHYVHASFGSSVLDEVERLNKPELGGGLALDIGCYLAQFALHIFGEDAIIENIFATGWTKQSVDDTACVVIKFDGERMASLTFSGSVVLKSRAEICGTKGQIEIPCDMNAPKKFLVTVKEEDRYETREHRYPRPRCDISKFHFPASNCLAFEADAVREHFLTGSKECCPQFTEKESYIVAEILESIRQQLGVV